MIQWHLKGHYHDLQADLMLPVQSAGLAHVNNDTTKCAGKRSCLSFETLHLLLLFEFSNLELFLTKHLLLFLAAIPFHFSDFALFITVLKSFT